MNSICERIGDANDFPGFYLGGVVLVQLSADLGRVTWKARDCRWENASTKTPTHTEKPLMTAAAVPADIVSARPAWHSLLWIVPLTVLWIVLIYWQPAISSSGVPTAAVRLMTYGLIGIGLWLGLETTDLTPGQRRATWLAVVIPFTLWMAVAWSGAVNGVFLTGVNLPVLPAAIFLPVIIGAPLLLLSKRVGQVLDAMPASWLVALQLYRVFGSWALAAALHGALPGLFGVPAGIGDTLTGLLAVPAAIAVATGTAQGRRAAFAWNILGLVDFAVAVPLGAITSPGPLQFIVPDVPSIGASAYPGVLTPAFVVPSSILLHALSLRQLYRRARREEVPS